MSTNQIQWYPGHVARARRQLQEQLRQVDLVFEVLDARIPQSCQHPDRAELIKDRERVVVLNRSDMVPPRLLRSWQIYLQIEYPTVVITNAKTGEGVRDLLKASQAAYQRVNARRAGRGMLARPVRAAVIGFPNVGKSALINRLVGKRAVASAAKPGVTRQVHWVRVASEIELLDSPGIMPVKFNDQEAAMKLAICDDIGSLGYSVEQVAARAFDLLLPIIPERLETRYHFEPQGLTGEQWLAQHAQLHHQDLTKKAGEQLLQDYRRGHLGAIALEFPPSDRD
ncbi:ribosome biogenesis GTPase YlqF [Candidatus Cyanaurora vandensis]|uniref:ribosome biogenesis GTPase YlqF n=1 Tax=Candidatus Cyanaurora vandensis TaxID=2714958 RepID=UPI00257FAC66|nr:ribosome biogenesis GTPase YlqF [Candidatus Cyanaurora vandensis]